ncbi:MAG: ABC transporter permease [Gemmatimonadaceae bacterium]
MRPIATALLVTRETLLLNPMRGILSTLGVIIGVASLVAVLSLGDGMERTARAQLSETTDLQSLGVESRVGEDIDGQTFAMSDTVPLTLVELRQVTSLPGVGSAGLLARAAVEVRSTDSTTRRMAGLMAVTAGIDRLSALKVAAGRMLSDADIDQGSGVMVSRQLAKDLTGAELSRAVGVQLLLNGRSYSVVGVVDGELGRTSRGVIAPYFPGMDTTFHARSLRYPTLIARATSVEDVARVERGIRELLQPKKTGTKSAFVIQSYRERAEQASQGILIFKLLMGAITGISLVVGGIGIMNVLLASVTERTREIGIRKASGARNRDILLQFLTESVAITGVGGLVGVVLGLTTSFGLTALIRKYASASFIQASFTWSSVLAAAFLSLLIGVAFGTYPARRAAGLSPIEAIRHE